MENYIKIMLEKKKLIKLLKNKIRNTKVLNEEDARISVNKDILQFLIKDFLKIENIYYLKCIDLSEISFAGLDLEKKDLSGTNANIDPQLVKNKSLYKTNLEGVDMSNKDFKDVFVSFANLKNTNANIDPQEVYDKNLYATNLNGLDMANKDFTGADIRFTNLNNTNATIYKELLSLKSLAGTKIESCKIDYTPKKVLKKNR